MKLVERRWRSELLGSVERFTFSSDPDGYRLAGNVRLVHESREVDIDYEVAVDSTWLTQTASVLIPTLDVSLDVRATADRQWMIDGVHRGELDGCCDIDLGFTPATNTIPMRRLEFVPDIPVTTRAAWLRWPELVLVPAAQTYTTHSEGSWTYRQGDFTAHLETDAQGVVLVYGRPAIWDGRPETDSG